MPPYGAFRKIGADRTLLWNGVNLASCDKAAATAAPFALSLRGKYFHRPLDKGQGV